MGYDIYNLIRWVVINKKGLTFMILNVLQKNTSLDRFNKTNSKKIIAVEL
jgi:hypothetical protein